MKIPLTGKFRGYFADVDDDQVWLLKYTWSGRKTRHGTLYAIVSGYQGKRICGALMHRLILGLKRGDPEVDHKNGDGLDNRKGNLRLCSRSQNMMNQRKMCGLSKYKGVSWHKRKKKWQAQITKDHKKIHLGYFNDEVGAAQIYDIYCVLLFGEFAKPNFPIFQSSLLTNIRS